MNFEITGYIREKESKLGVRGLMIRAYDKDLLYDDLLGVAFTDQKGDFKMSYSEKDFRELFDCKPDIYLSVYTPTCRLLVDTKKSIRWGASKQEYFELEIDRKTLGDNSPALPDSKVKGGISIKKDRLRLEKRDGFDVPILPGFRVCGLPGAPALPEQMQYVALPLGGDVLSIEVNLGDPVYLPGKINPLPIQSEMPDVGTDPKQFGDGISVHNTFFEFTPPDPKYFENKKPYPDKLVEIIKVEEIGAIQIAAVQVRPLQYDPAKKTFIFYPNLNYTVNFDLKTAKKYAEERYKNKTKIGQYYTEQIDFMLQQDLVHSARDLFWPQFLIPEEVPHIIITDNYQWPESIDHGDGTTRSPNLSERGTALTGNIVAEFERLAEWKTSRGVRSRVVTLSEIVNGTFGDFTEDGFARDLQEVLRNFIKFIHREWDTLYVLLAGDVNVVPMRKLTGSSVYKTIGCWQSTTNPPPLRSCYYISGGSVAKLRPQFTPISTDPLSTLHEGIRIPFDREAGSGRLGWYFTSENDFLTKDEGFERLPIGDRTNFIIVEGPDSILDDAYYWFRDVNSIPSDFYYASIEGPGYSNPGKHDFDTNNNGLYGQFHVDSATGQEESLDEVDFYSDVWVGRAPVETETQARGLVDKVITYEQLESPDGESNVDLTYLQKILYASAYWGRLYHSRQSDTTTPPTEGRFTHVDGSNVTKLYSKFAMTIVDSTPSYRVVARHTDANVVVPYNTAASSTNLGWFFCTDNTYATQSSTPTRFLKVLGPEIDIDTNSYLLDPVGLELAVEQKENLRGLMDSWYPNFNSIERHYSDYFDLTAPPSLVPLDAETIRASLDNGVHFASLSGHGGPGGCCDISIYSNPDFANSLKYFIMFANSCSTARPDNYDSLGEVSLFDPNGGAVGYVGNTRYGWTNIGDNYEEFFWNKVKFWGRLGIAAGLRLATGGVRQLWTFYTQTLFGDPEMPVWTDVPSEHEVTHPSSVNWGGTINVTVRKLGIPVGGHQVTILGGWSNSSSRPRVYEKKSTNSFGQVSFTLPAAGTPINEVKITVTYRNFKPFVGTINITD